MESEEDGMIVVIVKDDDEEETSNSIPASISIKEEVMDESENPSLVEELLETATKHGTHMDISKLEFMSDLKEEPCDYEYLDLDDELSTVQTRCDSDEEFILPDDPESDPDGEYDDDFLDSKCKKNVKKRLHHRSKMLSPSERVSFVQKLRDEHPEYEFQDNLLVQRIATVMRETKPLPPPRDFYRVHDLLFECTECCALSSNVPAAERHYQEKHGPRYLICLACGVDFRSKTNLYKHEKRCNSPDAVFVLRARALTVGRKGRHRPYLPKYTKKRDGYHISNKQSFSCLECAAVFRTKSGLTGHMHLHRGERPYCCEQCGAAYTTKSALYRHHYSHTDARYICDICNRQFKAKTAIIYHMDTHLPQRKFACTYEGCNQRYAQKYALTIHTQRVHENLPPPCACQICPRRFSRMSILKVHMKKEHGMILMTRNMFFKKLPKMSETQVQQAKIIFNNGNTESLLTNKEVEEIDAEESIDNSESFIYHHEVEAEPENETTNDESIIQFVKNFVIKQEAVDCDSKEGSIMVIENGEVEFIDKKNIRRKEYEQLIANFTSVIQNETPSSTSMPIL